MQIRCSASQFAFFHILVSIQLLLALSSEAQAQSLPRFVENGPPKKMRAFSAATAAKSRSLVKPDGYGDLPLSFELNVGQAAKKVQFLSRLSGSSLFLERDGASLQLPRGEGRSETLRIRFLG